jgi:arabinosaccharide transport system substrate-binding protein
MKKVFLPFLIIVTIMFLLVACNGGEPTTGKPSSDKGADKGKSTEISFWTFVEAHKNFYDDALERWNKENPDRQITLKSEVYPYDQMHNNLLMALQSGSGAPDMVDIEVSRFPNYLKGEPQLEPMNEYVEPVIDKFVKSRFEIYSKDGKYYGMPTHVGAVVMYYNTEIMKQAGVDIDSIKTWDDYIEAGKKVVEKTDAVMTTVDTGHDMQFWSITSQQGGDFINDDGEVVIGNEESVNALTLLSDMVHKYKIAELTPGGSPDASEEYFGFMNNGGAASLVMPMWYMNRFTDNMPDLKGKIAIRPLPAWEDGGFRSANMGGTGTVITNQAKDKELAKEFLAFAKLSKEGNIQLWKQLGFDPPRWDVWDSEEIKEDNVYYQYFGNDIFANLLEIKDEINPVHITETSPKINIEITTNTLNNVLRQQSKTPKEGLEDVKKAVNK